MKAVMRRTVRLAGTDLVLLVGTKVNVTPALNQPDSATKWFARPVMKIGNWKRQSEDTSILVETPKDILLLPED